MDKANKDLLDRLYDIKLNCLDLCTDCFNIEKKLPFEEPGNFEAEIRSRLFNVRAEINYVQNFINGKIREIE